MSSIRRVAVPLRSRGHTARAAVRAGTSRVAAWLRTAHRLPVVSAFTSTGWCVLLGGAGALVVGAIVEWAEAALAGALALVVVALCALFTIGRTNVTVDITVDDRRLRAGKKTTARLNLTNRARGPLLPLSIRIPIGPRNEVFRLPMLASGASDERHMEVHGLRRSVIPIGPVTTVRGDPFGLLARTVTWTDVCEVFVLPEVVELASIGVGLRHDLEGRTGAHLSSSDLAFHTLRDYVPGDDSRFIHWRSSAKVSTTTPGGRLLVRQFLETRRTHVLVVVDGDLDDYDDPDSFEVAVSAGASLALQVVRDQLEASVLVSSHVAGGATRREILETCARAVPTATALPVLVSRATQVAPHATAAFIVTGSLPDMAALRRAAGRLPSGLPTSVVRVDPQGRPPANAGALNLLTIRGLQDLRAVLDNGGGM